MTPKKAYSDSTMTHLQALLDEHNTRLKGLNDQRSSLTAQVAQTDADIDSVKTQIAEFNQLLNYASTQNVALPPGANKA